VETVLDGEAAYLAATARYEAAKTHTSLRQYDCILMALEFSAGGGGSDTWDGLQAIRQIRDWESLTVAPEEAVDNSTYTSIPIIAMSKLRNLVDDTAQAMGAGADLLLHQTVTDYTAVADLTNRVEKTQGTRYVYVICYNVICLLMLFSYSITVF
jgi:CheY-like chemotaxis protein